jgi:hypothetical protein
MITPFTSEHKSPATIEFATVHPCDLPAYQERIAAAGLGIDLGFGAEALAFIRSPHDVEAFLALDEQVEEGLTQLEDNLACLRVFQGCLEQLDDLRDEVLFGSDLDEEEDEDEEEEAALAKATTDPGGGPAAAENGEQQP